MVRLPQSPRHFKFTTPRLTYILKAPNNTPPLNSFGQPYTQKSPRGLVEKTVDSH